MKRRFLYTIVIAGTVLLTLAGISSAMEIYDSFSSGGGYDSSYWDTAGNATWFGPTFRDLTRGGGSTSGSGSTGGTSSQTSNQHCSSPPAGTAEALVDKQTHAVRYSNMTTTIGDIVGRAGGAELYMKKPDGGPDYGHIVGQICLVTTGQTYDVGYLYSDKVLAARRESGGAASPAPSPTPASQTNSACVGTTILDHKVPSDAFGVKMTQDGKIYYLGTTEQIADVHVDGVNKKIYYEGTGSTSGPIEVGQITVCGKYFPEYGHIFRLKLLEAKGELTSPAPAPAPAPSPTPEPTDLKVPEDATAVNINPDTGEVSNACSGYVYPDVRYDKAANKLLSDGISFGTVLTSTKGYINLDTRKANFTCYQWERVPESPPPPESIKDVTEKPNEEVPGPGMVPDTHDVPGPGMLELFQDVKSDASYAIALKFAVDNKWFEPGSKFKPNKGMKRCEFTEMVMKALAIQPLQEFDATFTDVPADNAYAPYVYTGLANNFWGSRPGFQQKNKFYCNSNLRRGEMALIFYSIFDIQATGDYTPKDRTPKWAKEAIEKAVAVGLMPPYNDEGEFKYKKTVKRHEAVSSIARAFGVQ